MASLKNANMLGNVDEFDKHSLCYKRHTMAKTKATEVMMEISGNSPENQDKVKYVLMDSWLSNPSQLPDIKALSLNLHAKDRKTGSRI